MSALIVTTDGAMWSMTLATSRRPSIGPLGSDTLIGSSLALRGGESIQSDSWFPTNAPVRPATQATTPTATTTIQFRRFRAAASSRTADGGMPGLAPGAGGGSGVMRHVYLRSPTPAPVGRAVLTSFTPLDPKTPKFGAIVASSARSARNLGLRWWGEISRSGS